VTEKGGANLHPTELTVEQPKPPSRVLRTAGLATPDLAAGVDDAIFAVRGLSKRFGGLRAVDGATFDVARGSITALIGPNGAGKTTLFNVVTGFYRADAGAVSFDGRSIFRCAPHAIAKRGMVRTFQITKALAAMSVIDNLMLAAPGQPGEVLANLLLRPRKTRAREREVQERAHQLLRVFDMERMALAYAGTLSGGQRKLLELARALMVEPKLVLLDEPMAGVNPTLGRRLLEHMHVLRSESDVTFLVVEHDMEVVMNEAERVIVMAEGSVISAGTPDQVRSDPRVVEAYLGREAGGASV
jgi:neutral amino acid transport system ATP-binding protein